MTSANYIYMCVCVCVCVYIYIYIYIMFTVDLVSGRLVLFTLQSRHTLRAANIYHVITMYQS